MAAMTAMDSATSQTLFFENMKPGPFSIFQFAIFTGLRRLEQFSIKTSDVEFIEKIENGRTIRKGMAYIADSKTGVSRYCALNEVAAHIAWVWSKKGHTYLFLGDDPNPIRLKVAERFDRKWRIIVKSIGLKYTGLSWHSARHTFATRALRAGARLQDVQRMLGHKSITQTERYAHWSLEALWPAADALCLKTV